MSRLCDIGEHSATQDAGGALRTWIQGRHYCSKAFIFTFFLFFALCYNVDLFLRNLVMKMKNVCGPLKKVAFIPQVFVQGKAADLMPLLFVI